MKLLPATFPLPAPSLPSARHRARLRENGPIRITLRSIESTPRADDGAAPLARKLHGTSATPAMASRVSATKKSKTSAPDDVLLMLL